MSDVVQVICGDLLVAFVTPLLQHLWHAVPARAAEAARSAPPKLEAQALNLAFSLSTSPYSSICRSLAGRRAAVSRLCFDDRAALLVSRPCRSCRLCRSRLLSAVVDFGDRDLCNSDSFTTDTLDTVQSAMLLLYERVQYLPARLASRIPEGAAQQHYRLYSGYHA